MNRIVLMLATIAFFGATLVAAQPTTKQADPKKANGDSKKEPADPADELAKQVEDALKLLAETDKAKINPRPKGDPKKKVIPPPPIPMRSAGVPFVAVDAIKIDGDLADWKGLKPIVLDPVVRGRAPKGAVVHPEQQRAWLAHCARGLIVAVDVIDTSGDLENGNSAQGNFWDNDCVEIYVDTLNAKSPSRGEPNTHQFFAFPFGSKNDPASGGHEAYIFFENGKAKTKRTSFPMELMPRAAKKTELGWTMEMLIPKPALRKGDVNPGRVVGFNLQIDTGTNVFYFWNGADHVQTSMRPNTWGDVQLLGTDAKLELVPAAALVRGQPVKIRVTDPDVNLDDTKKDKLNVTLRVGAAEAKTVALEETGDRTGVFEASVLVDPLEGDQVTVEYVDQVRASDERNVPVRVVLPLAKGKSK